MPLDKPKNVANDSLKTPYVTVNNNITPLGTSTFTQLSGTQTNRPTSPAIGTFYYDTTTGQTEVYTANGWVNPATAPNAPTNVTAANQAIAYGGTPAAYVYFTPATTGNPATTYTVNSNTGGFTATGTSSPISITGLSAGTSYTFTVTATNAYGSAVSSASGSLTAATVPQTPTIGTATVSANSASVTFTPGNNGGASATTYTVYASGGYGIFATGTSSPITVSGLTAGQSYTFTVTASNSAGTSSASSPSNSITALQPFTVDYLLVGGGGGGGTTDSSRPFANPASWSGGGGAGGYVSGSANLNNLSVYAITIGNGSSPGGSGGNSTFNGLTALGGGYGGNSNSSVVQNGVAGGSGRGGGGDVPGLVYPNSGIGGASTQSSTYGYGYGNAGGNGYDPSPERPGGGGGAGAAGAAGPVSSGGNGLQWLDGNYYAGGGGGNAGTAATTTNTGGLGGGGNGSTLAYLSGSNATNATANTGGGGAGGTSGGSGICIIRYPGSSSKATGGAITTNGGYVYHTFTGNGSFIPNGANPLASVTSATLTNWYDFSNSSFMTLNGSNISTVIDLSGNNRNLTAVGTVPLASNQINSLSVASINSGSYLSIANPITYTSTNIHWFVVVQPKSSAPSHDNGLIGGTGDPGILAYTLPGSSGNGFTQSLLNTSRYWFATPGSFGGYSTSRAYQINASYVLSSGAYVYRQSRTADGSGTQALGSGYSSPTNAIGYQESGYPGVSYIGEVIMFNGPLNSTDLATVENYLYSKWGV